MKSVIGLVLAGMVFAGCAASNRAPVTGSLYNAAANGVGVTSNQMGSKKGQACASSILGAIGLGDASVETAAKAGGISTVSHVDATNMAILGLYAKTCTIVYGN